MSFDEMFSQSDTTVFSFKIPALPTNDDLIRKIIIDLNLPNLTLTYDNQPNQTVNAPVFLNTIYKSSSSFEDFISRIDENWPTLNIYNDVNYVSNRMIYVRIFYSKIGENDVSRIIYRLMCIHLIRDYTYDYNLNIFTCEIAKTNVENYINATQGFLKQYISNESASIKINQLKDSLNELDTLSAIKKCLRTILEFTYLEIVSKRKRAVDDLHKFIDDSINKADETTNNSSFKNFWYNHYFKEELYYYFNAKYARKGFKILQKNYSLTDDTNEGRTSSWNVFDKYAAILNEQSSFISECKMMRGSCRRIWRSLTETDFKNEWVLKMLYSFATYGLNNEYYLKEANTNFCDSFRIYFFSISCDKSYKLFSEKISEYERLLIKSITNEVHIKYFKLTKQALMLEVHLDHVNSMLSYHQNKIKTFQDARL